VAIEELVRKYKTLENICKYFIEHDYDELWLQDPVLKKKRNLLASINKTRFKQIQKVCEEYLKNKKINYQKYTLDEYLKKHANMIHIFVQRRRTRDIDYNTVRSLCEKACNAIKSREPDIKTKCDAYAFNDVIVVSFDVTPRKLPSTRTVEIPAHMTESIEAFKQKHPDVEIKVKGNKVVAEVPRKIINPVEAIINELKQRLSQRGYKITEVKGEK